METDFHAKNLVPLSSQNTANVLLDVFVQDAFLIVPLHYIYIYTFSAPPYVEVEEKELECKRIKRKTVLVKEGIKS